MCGIAGILGFQSGLHVNKHQLEKMIGMLQHRGPDGVGYFTSNNIGLGHARLSIIDIEGGRQPIHNEDKTVWVIFNGEIFNYIELRKTLESKGHIFYTKTDTEVIVHLYEQYGEKFVKHLNGQFAIALWDDKKKRLILVRDRVGILPLFYKCEKDRLLFSSEIKAILAACAHSPKLNSDALDQILTFWSPISPETIFDDVYEVSPGELIIIDNSILKKRKYWDWEFPENDDYNQSNEDELAESLHDLLLDATRIRLRSDVPVGAYLSGGLDSSVLTSLIHNYSDAPLRTFSIGFKDKSFDESIYQRQMIEYLGATHSNVECTDTDIARDFLSTIWHTESPIIRTAPVPMGILSKLVKNENYKVVLTGEGSDEVLGGYDIFKEAKIRQFWAKNPESHWRPLLLKRLYPYLDLSKSQGLTYMKSFFGAALDNPDLSYFSHIPRWETTAKCKEFFADDIKEQLRNNAIDLFSKILPDKLKDWAPFNRAQYIEAKSLMSGYLLCSQGDRMLMKNSVEGRFPFLDHRVIEFANKMHPKLKMKVLNEKYLLKKSMKNYIPETIIKRYKQPYRAPDIPGFFSKESFQYVKELLSHQKINDYGYFSTDKVMHLIKKIERGRVISQKDNMAFISILSTQVWHYHFIENFSQNFNFNKRNSLTLLKEHVLGV